MKELFKVMRLAFYVCALPLVATATVSAFQLMESNTDKEIKTTAASATTLQDQHVTYVVRRSAEGVVTGRVVKINPTTSKINGIGGLSVQFAQNGNLVAKTTTDSDGNFSVGDMDTGSYSFFGIGEDEFVAFATRIVDDSTENAAHSLFVESAATSGMTDTLKRQIREQRSQNMLSSLTPETRPEFTKLSGGARVELSADGTLKGRAVSLYREGNERLGGTTVQLFQGGKLVDETKTDDKGYYTFYNVEDGIYDLFAHGRSGFAAFRFDAARKQMSASISAVAIESGMAPIQEFALTPYNDAVFADRPVIDRGPIVPLDGGVAAPVGGPAPVVGNGFGGFAPAGPVGGGPIFGGGGRLLPLAALGIGIAALADNNNNPPGPASPNQ